MAAASTFSTLWRPRMGISPAVISSAPSSTSLSAHRLGAGRHLAARAEPLDGGGGPFGVLRRTPGLRRSAPRNRRPAGSRRAGPWPRRKLSNVWWRSRWFCVTLSASADVRAELARSSRAGNWKAPARSSHHRESSPPSTSRPSRCFRPPAPARRHSRRMWPIRLVVVVLPFDPVIPMVRPLRNGAASSTSPITRAPRARALPPGAADRPARRAKARSSRSLRKPRASAARTGRSSRASSSAAPGSWSSGFRSVARTDRAAAAAETPPKPCRTSSARRPARECRSVPWATSASAWSAQTAPAPVRQSRSAR